MGAKVFETTDMKIGWTVLIMVFTAARTLCLDDFTG
jgi:hypothetical protein